MIQPPLVRPEPARKIGPVARRLRRPADLGQRARARERHVFNVRHRGDVFGPDVALAAQDMRRLVRQQPLGQRLEGINLFQREKPADGARFERRGLRLAKIKVAKTPAPRVFLSPVSLLVADQLQNFSTTAPQRVLLRNLSLRDFLVLARYTLEVIQVTELKNLSALLKEKAQGKDRFVVAISGFGGSGKSTIASRLARELGDVALVRLDDFVVDRLSARSADWGGFDWSRLITQVLQPLRSGANIIAYEQYDWENNGLGEKIKETVSKFVIIEGVGLIRKEFHTFF